MLDGYMSVAEAVERLGVSRQAIADARQRGRIEGVKIGGVWLLRAADVDAYAGAQRGGPGRPRPTRGQKRGQTKLAS